MNKYKYTEFTKLCEEDVLLVLKWRNDPTIRLWMYNKHEISNLEHSNFITSLSNNTLMKYWLVHRNGSPIGVSSVINIANNSGEWGYYLDPQPDARVHSFEFYVQSLKYLFDEIQLEKIYGFTLKDNPANVFNDFFGFDKILIKKKTNGVEAEYYYREIKRSDWLEKVVNRNTH
jgi:UDP-4-amino-4,6-dideoxy-N-acetyl-beta-L-altrosamine N-acetyltransferase